MSRQCRENRFPWNGLRHLGDSGNGGTTLGFLSPFLWRTPPLEIGRERRDFFADHAGKGSLLSSQEAETGLLWMWRVSRASSRVEMGMSGNFLSCSKGMKDPLEVPGVRCDKAQDASSEMGLISNGGMHVRFSPELWQQCGASLRVDQGICGFPSRLSQEAFPRSFPTGLSHVPPWC